MGSPQVDESQGRRRSGRGQPHYGPALWIALLLASWFLIAEWRMLPELITKAMAALP
jgi:hypothetical protein